MLLAREQHDGRLPSVVGGVVRDGELVWSGAVGGADGVVPGPDVQYRIGSITKTLVAVLVLQLRDEGVLDLNDRLDEHLPGIGYGDRTLRDLLSHATGMHSEPAGSWWERTPGGTFDELAAGLSEDDAPFAPGATFHYTNVAFGLLGEVVGPAPGPAVVRRGPGADPRAARHDPDDVPPEAPHASGFSVHHYAGTLTAEPASTPVRWRRPARCGARSRTSRATRAFLAVGDERVHRARDDRGDVHPAVGLAGQRPDERATASGIALTRGGSGMLVGHTGSMPGFLAGCFADPVRRTAAVVMANAHGRHALPRVSRWTCSRRSRSREGTVPVPWRPSRDVPESVLEILGVWHWGNTALSFAWDGSEVVVSNPVRRAESHRFVPEEGGTFLGTRGYHHGETAARRPQRRRQHQPPGVRDVRLHPDAVRPGRADPRRPMPPPATPLDRRLLLTRA